MSLAGQAAAACSSRLVELIKLITCAFVFALQGGFSRVVLARERSSGQQVALKICLQYNAHCGAEVLEVLPTCEVLKEAALHRSLATGQPSIVPVLDAFQCKIPVQQTQHVQEQQHQSGSGDEARQAGGAAGSVEQHQPGLQMAGCIVMPIMQGNLQEVRGMTADAL
jgi:hypothetical protein